MSYDSLIGDMGSSLSGGQRQRILLARALYRRPRLLFMDEGTSQLDTMIEARVNTAIRLGPTADLSATASYLSTYQQKRPFRDVPKPAGSPQAMIVSPVMAVERR